MAKFSISKSGDGHLATMLFLIGLPGLHSTYKYCDRHSIPYKKCGKLVVATDATEIGRLEALFERATENGVPDIELVDTDGIKKREPICEGLKALWEATKFIPFRVFA